MGWPVKSFIRSQGLFYFKVADPLLMSAIFRAYNDWLAEFCRTDPARLKGIAMINLDDVEDGIRELERAARLGLSGAMITEYPAEDRRYDQPEYEPFWAAAAALDLPLSLHTATRRQGKIRGAGPGTLRDASSRATKAFYPALSMCDMIFSGVFERHPRLTLAIVEFELAWAPNVLSSMDYTYRERHGEAIYRFKNGMLPSDFFHRNVVLSFQEDAIGIRLRDVIGVDNMMWGSDYPHSELTFPQSRKILAEILAGRAGRRTGQDRRRQHRPRVQFRRGEADRPCLKSQPLCGSSICRAATGAQRRRHGRRRLLRFWLRAPRGDLDRRHDHRLFPVPARALGANRDPHHQRSARHQPRRLRHHLQTLRYDRVGVSGVVANWRTWEIQTQQG